MLKPSFAVLLCATLVPMAVGFIWYNPKFGFGLAWMRASGFTGEGAKGRKMGLIFALTIILSFLAAFMLQYIVIHQFAVKGLLSQQPDFSKEGSESSKILTQFMDLYGNSFRTFRHGMLHGALTGLLFVTPIFAINALFERKGFKYIAINGGYWIVTLALMGGIICGFT